MTRTNNQHTAVRMLCEGALLIAFAEILSFLPLYKMPWGGSIDLAMLPIFVFCARWGFGPGLLVSVAHAILQTLFEGGIAIGWESILGDFLVAYTVMGFAGLFWKRKGGFYLGTLVGCGLRFLVLLRSVQRLLYGHRLRPDPLDRLPAEADSGEKIPAALFRLT